MGMLVVLELGDREVEQRMKILVVLDLGDHTVHFAMVVGWVNGLSLVSLVAKRADVSTSPWQVGHSFL